jgi:hypothetical protein
MDFANKYLLERIYGPKPASFSMPIAPTRNFWMHVFTTRIEAWVERMQEAKVFGHVGLQVKDSLLRALPLILPEESPSTQLYRFVLEHNEFGVHKTTVAAGIDGLPQVTSLFDWEYGRIVPALAVDPTVQLDCVDLCVDQHGQPGFWPQGGVAPQDEHMMWAEVYVQVRKFHTLLSRKW